MDLSPSHLPKFLVSGVPGKRTGAGIESTTKCVQEESKEGGTGHCKDWKATSGYLNAMSLLEQRAQSQMAAVSGRALVGLALLGNASSFMSGVFSPEENAERDGQGAGGRQERKLLKGSLSVDSAYHLHSNS